MHVKMFYALVSEFSDHIFQPRLIIGNRLQTAALARVDMPEIDGGEKNFVDLAKGDDLLERADLSEFSHRFGTE